jgi:hypothetical protein
MVGREAVDEPDAPIAVVAVALGAAKLRDALDGVADAGDEGLQEWQQVGVAIRVDRRPGRFQRDQLAVGQRLPQPMSLVRRSDLTEQ